MVKKKIMQPNHEAELMLRDATRNIVQPSRRAFLQRTLTLGGLTLLTGCTPDTAQSMEAALMRISAWNDGVQGLLFSPNALAPTYPESMIRDPFPFNAYYGEEEIRQVNGDDWRLELSGLVADRTPWRLEQLRRLPQEAQVTRHICVEGWSAIGKWGGVPLGAFLRRIGADLSAKYVGFACADDYYTSIDMASALHPQTLMALDWNGRDLPPRYGFPMKVRIPTKLGYKNPKHVHAMFVTNTYPGGYW
jgi:DMSO/TMAO reductase YedYZ molybdopterin-dependent catalytic subunit